LRQCFLFNWPESVFMGPNKSEKFFILLFVKGCLKRIADFLNILLFWKVNHFPLLCLFSICPFYFPSPQSPSVLNSIRHFNRGLPSRVWPPPVNSIIVSQISTGSWIHGAGAGSAAGAHWVSMEMQRTRNNVTNILNIVVFSCFFVDPPQTLEHIWPPS